MRQDSASKGSKRPVRIGKYEVIAHIATGGMGAVYKALDTDLQRPVALKILSAEMAAKPNMVERFKREGISAAKLRHENIVAIHECGEWGGTLFLALEFVDGNDLHDYVARRGRLDVDEARQILVQAATALDHAHRNNIVHRDIKPSNFLITKYEDGRLLVKLTDLGLARQVNDDEFRVTKADSTIGTVDYMAPEQAQDSGSADIRSDIYSLGCTYYHMLSGKCPFPTGSLVERVLKHREADPPDIRALNPAVPAPVVEVLRKMLAKKPEERFQTPLQLLQALEELDHSSSSLPKARPLVAAVAPEQPTEPKLVPPTDEYMRRAPTAESPRSGLPSGPRSVGAKNRSRDRSATRTTGKRNNKRMPVWWPWAAGCAAACFTAVIAWSLLGSSERQDIEDSQTDAPQPVAKNSKPQDGKNIRAREKPVQARIGPEEPLLPRLLQPAQPLELAALRREFLGPFQEVPTPPAQAAVVRVRRLPGPGEYRSVAEALAKTAGPLVVEIHDQGPIFEPSLPEARERSLWVRAGAGYRPLWAWDASAGKEQASFLALSGGSLTLEDIDVVAKGSAGRGDDPKSLFTIRGGRLQATNCTFTVAGKYPRGIVLVKLEPRAEGAASGLRTTAAPLDSDRAAVARVHLKCCHVRGSDLTVLDVRGTSIEGLVEGSLLVGGDRPMVRIAGNDENQATLRLVRSTLVCGQNCVHWQHLAGKPISPHMKVLAWDALITRARGGADQGDMLALDDGDLVHVTWRPVNCVYAGWKRLLFSTDKSVASGSLDTWRALWSIREGDHELAEPWPQRLPSEPETLAAQEFSPYDTAALFAATGGPGPLGCELGRLPPEPHLALERTFERYPLPVMPLPESDELPAIPTSNAGLYEGERLDLTKVDLGKHLQARLRATRPGPRIVLRLTGTGKHYTSPIAVKGVSSIVICFETAGQEEPLTLLPRPQAVDENRALIEVEDGNLEMIKARFVLENKRTGSAPAHLIRIRGGNLVLTDCYLQGPLDKAPEGYQGLIHFESAANGTDDLPGALLKDSVLLSARSLLDLRGGARVRVRNCAALAVEDGLVIAPGPLPRPNVFVQLENNTLAVRKALLAASGDDGDLCGGIVVQAQHNYILNPFADDPRRGLSGQAHLVRVSGASLAHGILHWQGKENAFDSLRLVFFEGAKDEPGRQSFKDWQQLWGIPGEQDAVFLEPVKSSKAFSADPPSWQYLSLPARARAGTGTPAFGADLVRLGIMKRKG
jgi:serine/threonine protein kinase